MTNPVREMIASAPFPPQKPVALAATMNFLSDGVGAILALGASFAAYVSAGYFERITRRGEDKSSMECEA